MSASVISMPKNRLGWEHSTDTKSVGDMDSGPACECSKEWGDFFHHFGTKLDDAKSVEEFKALAIALIRQIWLASNAQRMSTCIIAAVRDCLEYCKQTKLPVNPSVQFYNFLLEGKSLPAWIILHAPSDDLSQVGIRHYLLQLFLDEFPLTEVIRDELYLACATRGFNNFFRRVRAESLKRLQARRSERVEIGQGLRPPSCLTETLTVVPKNNGFKMKWFVPDMLQRLESGRVIGIEFVAKGQVWGMYIRSQSNRWEISVHPLVPSRIYLKDFVEASLKVSRHGRRKIFSRGSTCFGLFGLYCGHVPTVNLPVEGGMPARCQIQSFRSRKGQKCLKCINKDGSCYLTLSLSNCAL